MEPNDREPAWAWALAGLLAALLARGAARTPAAPVDPAEAARWRPREDPAAMAVRDLRRLPGLGDARAAAAADARFAHPRDGPPLRWEDVHGIGEVTARRAAAALAERGVGSPGTLVPSRGNP